MFITFGFFADRTLLALFISSRNLYLNKSFILKWRPVR